MEGGDTLGSPFWLLFFASMEYILYIPRGGFRTVILICLWLHGVFLAYSMDEEI